MNKRYAILVTEKVNREDPPIHFLRRGTLVLLTRGEHGPEVETLNPCFGVACVDFSYSRHRQLVTTDDVLEIDSEQLKALSSCIPLHPLAIASALANIWPEIKSKSEQVAELQSLARAAFANHAAQKLLFANPAELLQRLTMHLPEV